MAKDVAKRRIPAIKVKQWLPGWDRISFDLKRHRAKPPPHFFVFSLPAQELRSLSGIARRQALKVSARVADLGIQRQHDADRSDEISRFVEFGYPWSTLSERKRKEGEFNDLRKPGWLPTAIVINILRKEDARNGSKVLESDLVHITEEGNICEFELPYASWTKSWTPAELPPFEVIDGQHRLWAFGHDVSAPTFELPVVAFFGLDISWQAYLFYTINIKPKRINASLAFDLYPLLRSEDWLDRAEGHAVYRETRSQELTESIWSHPESPWYDHVNMLGDRQAEGVSQSAWINTLMATLVKPWEGRGKSLGGLFGSRLKEEGEVLNWSRAQQAAFLIFSWQCLRDAVAETSKPWARDLRKEAKSRMADEDKDAAFYGPYSIISSDQGVRGFMSVVNDLCFVSASKLKLDSWQIEGRAAATDTDAVSLALKSIKKHGVAQYLKSISECLAAFDWRTSATPELSDEQRRAKLVFRGSSGYRELRAQLLECISVHPGTSSPASKRLLGLS